MRRRTDADRLRNRKASRIKYQKRKAAGRCAYFTCAETAEPGHTQCQQHLKRMSQRALEKRNERIAQGLCIACGELPEFWGRKCIICRQTVATDPLPSGAKRALRLHREGEARRLHEEVEKESREAVLSLLKSQNLRGKRAEALRLYAGIENGKWRTYEEVAKLMKISKERVRQLLLPAKLTLTASLSGRVPWQSLEQHESNSEGKIGNSLSTACTVCNNIALKIVDHEFYLYEDCGLPNVVLLGLPVNHCQNCNAQTPSIPHISDLHRKLVRAILLKPAALSGHEFQFLRTVAGLSRAAFAVQLGVAIQTIQAWEASEALRYLNDLGARMVIATLIAPEEDWSPIFKVLSSIKVRSSEPHRLSAYWIDELAVWVVTLPGACGQWPPSLSPNLAALI